MTPREILLNLLPASTKGERQAVAFAMLSYFDSIQLPPPADQEQALSILSKWLER